MIFTDEDSRHTYHKTPVLLQVVCQVLESNLAAYGVQLELVDAEKRGGFWIAAVAVADEIEEEALLAVIEKTNDLFKRNDEFDTCILECNEVGLMTLRVTDASDFSQVH